VCKDIQGNTLKYKTKAEYVAWQLSVVAKRTAYWKEYISMGENVLKYLKNWEKLKVETNG